MADEKDDIPEGDGEGETVVEEKQQEVTEAPEEEPKEEEPDPYAPIAQKMGWVPKDQFRGNPDDWKPAEQYILDGKDIQKATARELKEMRATLDNVSRTSAAILQERIDQERQQLAAEYSRAVEEGDTQKSWEVAQRLQQTQQKAAGPPPPAPEAVEWAQRNPWFNNDPVAQQLAVQTAEIYARAGKPVHEQLAAAEREVKRYYPQHFEQQRKAPEVNTPGPRTAAPSNRTKGFADMPRAAQDVAKDMVDRGVIKTVDDYSRNYWATEGNKQ